MAELFLDLTPAAAYVDRKEQLKANSDEDYYAIRQRQMKSTTSVYVGNLAYYTTERQVEDLFSCCGQIADIVMGLHKFQRTPCGFCFVVYQTQQSAINAVNTLNGAFLDDRRIRVDFDTGSCRDPRRYFGRSFSGESVQEAYRPNFDPGRGGLGLTETGGRCVLENELPVYSWIKPPAMKANTAGQPQPQSSKPAFLDKRKRGRQT
jgi:nuclear cap-binding protein subunit 2